MKIIKNDKIIDNSCVLAKSFFQKFIGKMFLHNSCFLQNCNSIHTIFLRDYIDVVFINSEGKVVKILENLPPKVIIFPVKNAIHTIEFNAGFIKSAKIVLGDILIFEE